MNFLVPLVDLLTDIADVGLVMDHKGSIEQQYLISIIFFRSMPCLLTRGGRSACSWWLNNFLLFHFLYFRRSPRI